jgi:protein TonB
MPLRRAKPAWVWSVYLGASGAVHALFFVGAGLVVVQAAGSGSSGGAYGAAGEGGPTYEISVRRLEGAPPGALSGPAPAPAAAEVASAPASEPERAPPEPTSVPEAPEPDPEPEQAPEAIGLAAAAPMEEGLPLEPLSEVAAPVSAETAAGPGGGASGPGGAPGPAQPGFPDRTTGSPGTSTAASGAAQGAGDAAPTRPEPPLVVQPERLESPEPTYPALSRRLAEEGVVLCLLSIDARGAVSGVEVLESSGFARLDEAALRALRLWRFRPGKVDGVPTPSTYRHRVRFRLD